MGGIHACGASVAPVAPDRDREAFLTAAAVDAHARLDNNLYHQPTTLLLALEYTLNGAVMPLPQLEECVGAARRLGLGAHLDGARLWHAVAASAERPLGDRVRRALRHGLGVRSVS